VHTPSSVLRTARHRGAAVAIALSTITACTAGVLVAVTGIAGAAPSPTIAQVQQKLKTLDQQAAKLGAHFDQVKEQLVSANQQLKLVNQQASKYQGEFNLLRGRIGKIGAAAFMNGNLTSGAALLASGNPQQILDQSSILTELSSVNSAQLDQFVNAARQLTRAQQTARRAQASIAALKASLIKQKKVLDQETAQQKTLLAQLTPAQQVAVGGGGGGGGGAPPPKYTGPTSTQAQQAVAFAYQQLNCPYVFGGTGPCSAGFDCSGLTMQAWASAGVSIPRTSFEQWDNLPHVSTSALEPGDILVFTGASHVAIYVGNGKLIQAPQTGENVDLEPLSGWFSANLDGAVRP
jgi:cell wall-associated NlpC family hydrolase